ncbi:Neuroligin 4-like [Frankliniella fusca]|uniref:Neuroligin 4-like n=1 Tax=Frankliniella fusca TaxID=407009 RepID=A0AAE1H8S3_9NEOP|nr:Neuroligin 4-like [Frankliniella fusca]
MSAALSWAGVAVLVLAAALASAAPAPQDQRGAFADLSPFAGLGGLGAHDDQAGKEDGEDAERQSILWRAMPKPRAAAPPAPSSSGTLREILGRVRNPKKSAQFTPTGVLAEGADSDMISDPGPPPSYPYHHHQHTDDNPPGAAGRGHGGVPRYSSSGVTREIAVRQGRLVGVVRAVPGFGEVHQFLGLPYAEPPVGSQRFMPPASPSQWKGLRVADRFGHVCPQVLPDLSLLNVSAGRLSAVQRLVPYLQDQSEDCLYLNVYAPAAGESAAKLERYER